MWSEVWQGFYYSTIMVRSFFVGRGVFWCCIVCSEATPIQLFFCRWLMGPERCKGRFEPYTPMCILLYYLRIAYTAHSCLNHLLDGRLQCSPCQMLHPQTWMDTSLRGKDPHPLPRSNKVLVIRARSPLIHIDHVTVLLETGIQKQHLKGRAFQSLSDFEIPTIEEWLMKKSGFAKMAKLTC